MDHLAKRTVAELGIEELSLLAPQLASLPMDRLWIDHDRDADVLYISSRRPQQATDSEMLENGILLRYCGEDAVEVTILDASRR